MTRSELIQLSANHAYNNYVKSIKKSTSKTLEYFVNKATENYTKNYHTFNKSNLATTLSREEARNSRRRSADVALKVMMRKLHGWETMVVKNKKGTRSYNNGEIAETIANLLINGGHEAIVTPNDLGLYDLPMTDNLKALLPTELSNEKGFELKYASSANPASPCNKDSKYVIVIVSSGAYLMRDCKKGFVIKQSMITTKMRLNALSDYLGF